MILHAAVSLLGARAAGRSGDSVHGDRRLPHRAGRTQADGAGCGPGDRPRRRRRPRQCAHRAGDALHCLPVGGGRARHDNEPMATRPSLCCGIRSSATRSSPTRVWCRAWSRSACAGTRRSRTRRSATRPRRSCSAGSSSRHSRRSSCRSLRRTGTPRAMAMRSRSTSTAPTAGTSLSATESTTVWERRWREWRRVLRSPRCTAGSPRCGWPSTPLLLRWGHGDGLVIRGLSELPVLLGPAATRAASAAASACCVVVAAGFGLPFGCRRGGPGDRGGCSPGWAGPGGGRVGGFGRGGAGFGKFSLGGAFGGPAFWRVVGRGRDGGPTGAPVGAPMGGAAPPGVGVPLPAGEAVGRVRPVGAGGGGVGTERGPGGWRGDRGGGAALGPVRFLPRGGGGPLARRWLPSGATRAPPAPRFGCCLVGPPGGTGWAPRPAGVGAGRGSGAGPRFGRWPGRGLVGPAGTPFSLPGFLRAGTGWWPPPVGAPGLGGGAGFSEGRGGVLRGAGVWLSRGDLHAGAGLWGALVRARGVSRAGGVLRGGDRGRVLGRARARGAGGARALRGARGALPRAVCGFSRAWGGGAAAAWGPRRRFGGRPPPVVPAPEAPPPGAALGAYRGGGGDSGRPGWGA